MSLSQSMQTAVKQKNKTYKKYNECNKRKTINCRLCYKSKK